MSDQTQAIEQANGNRPKLSELKVRPGEGIVLESVRDLHQFAVFATAQGMAPSSFKDRRGEWNTQAITLALIKGMELGMKPTQALQNIYVVNNQPTIYGDAVPALMFATGQVTHFHEYMTGTRGEDDWTAVCELRRKGMDNVHTTTFSVLDAKAAGLWEKRGKNGQPTPWILYPADMLTWRARGRNARALFADALKGLGIYEEVRDIPPDVSVEEPEFASRQDEMLASLTGGSDSQSADGETQTEEPPTGESQGMFDTPPHQDSEVMGVDDE